MGSRHSSHDTIRLNDLWHEEPGSLCLGTATLGLTYGVSNPSQTLAESTAQEILDVAQANGIKTLDTAPAYGDAEARIGRWLKAGARHFRVVTKLPALTDVPDGRIGDAVTQAALASARRLGVDRLDGYIAHMAADYTRPAVRDAMAALKATGRVGAIGVSVYTPEQALTVLDWEPPDIIQLPLSILDRRALEMGVVKECQKAGVAVFVRSIFLQGALFLDPCALPPHLAPLGQPLLRLQRIAEEARTSLASLAVRWIRDQTGVTSAVVGVYNARQLAELIASNAEPPLTGGLEDAIAQVVRDIPSTLR